MPGEPAPAESVERASSAAVEQARAAAARGRAATRSTWSATSCSGGRRRRAAGAADAARRDEFVVRFQQTCGPVMAKGVEDTAFYRWHRLVALNEVGGDPEHLGVPPEEFHAFAAHAAGDVARRR